MASGEAPLEYLWLHNDEPLDPAETGPDLMIDPVSAADEGLYSCLVSNSCGSVSSPPAQLTVAAGSPPTIITHPEGGTCCAGDAMALSVQAGGDPPLRYQWRAGGSPVAGATDSTLVIDPAASSSAGSYDVVVSNPWGTTTSAPVDLVVHEPPAITAQPASHEACEGDSVTLRISTTDGSGPVGYQWRRDGVALVGSTEAALTLESVDATSFGTYDVVVTGPCGQVVSSPASLTLAADCGLVENAAPDVDAGEDLAVTLPDSALLDATVTDDGLPDPPGSVELSWSQTEGPGAATIVELASLETRILFDLAGEYEFALEAFDGELSSSDRVRITVSPEAPPPPPEGRVSSGLCVLYTFEEGSGTIVEDVSGVGDPLDLTIADPTAVTWGAGTLGVDAVTSISSVGPATKVHDAVTATGEITIEAWITPANLTQDGPARIVTLSDGPYRRNFTLGQGKWGSLPSDVIDARLRTTSTSANGTPSVSTPAGSLVGGLRHIVYSRSTVGDARIYLDAVQRGGATVPGSLLSSWDESFVLAIANEPTRDRPWRGTLHLVAVYGRALSEAEVAQNFSAGLGATPPPVNQIPSVCAGPDRWVTLPGEAILDGAVTDDGLPDPPAALELGWRQTAGPASASILAPTSEDTRVAFDVPGEYEFELEAFDGELGSSDRMRVTVETAAVDPVDPIGGLAVHLHCGDGLETEALAAGGRFLVHALDEEASLVRTARERLRSTGQYGRVSAARFDGETLPYADDMVNLIVTDDLRGVPFEEAMRVLAPGGVLRIGSGSEVEEIVHPPLAGTDEWTHFLHDASGNAVARDRVVGPPRSARWIAGPRHTRSHEFTPSLNAVVTAGGRVYYISDEGPRDRMIAPADWHLVARDAYNGTELWKRRFGPWFPHIFNWGRVPAQLQTRLVATEDRVFVTLGIHAPLSALDARVDGPPTLCAGFAIFGSRDGSVYCVRISDGALAWRLRADRDEHMICVDGQLESSSPVPGAVAADGNSVWFTAGRSSYVDGGVDLCRVSVATGEVLSRTSIHSPDPVTGLQPPHTGPGTMPGMLGDVISTDEGHVYLRDAAFDHQGTRLIEGHPHIFSATGFLDDSWSHRSYWIFGTECSVTTGCTNRPPGIVSGRILSLDPETIYGYGRDWVDWSNPFEDGVYRLFAKPRGGGSERWSRQIPIRGRALVRAGGALLVAGPVEDSEDPPAWLLSVSALSGDEIGRTPLSASPVFDGMAATDERLYATLENGEVLALEEAR